MCPGPTGDGSGEGGEVHGTDNGDSDGPAVTIAAAAEQLGIGESAVHYLLKRGELTGPKRPAGRQRHARGALRVSERSLKKRLRSLDGEDDQDPDQRPDTDLETAAVAEDRIGLPGHDFRAMALDLKVQLDEARAQLRATRQDKRALARQLAALNKTLQDAYDEADRVDDMATTYSNQLTDFLGPTDPSDL